MKIETSFVKTTALSVGFSDCGVAPVASDMQSDATYNKDLQSAKNSFNLWLKRGYYADMGYMNRNSQMRHDPSQLVTDARSVISLVVAYKPDRQMDGPLKIAQYAYGEDYHERLKRMQYLLMAKIRDRYPDFESRPFVDTAPISDRYWAVQAGLGWIGKNTLFYHRNYGSFCFLGEIVTTMEMSSYDEPLHQQDRCAGCNLCVDACPNHAIVASGPTEWYAGDSPANRLEPFMVDACRCTSYNTIENRKPTLPHNLNTRGYIFGCDICQLVCPFNQQVPPSFHLTDERKTQLEALPQSDERTFKTSSKHSALSRIKYFQWQRNIQHCK